MKTLDKIYINGAWVDAVTTGTNWTLDHTATVLPEGIYGLKGRVIDAGRHRVLRPGCRSPPRFRRA